MLYCQRSLLSQCASLSLLSQCASLSRSLCASLSHSLYVSFPRSLCVSLSRSLSAHLAWQLSLQLLLLSLVGSALSAECPSLPAPREPLGISQLLQASGRARLGAKLPHFAGWQLSPSRVQNRDMLLQRLRRREGARGLVLVLGGSFCPPCVQGLRRLAAEQQRLAREGFELVLLLGESEGCAARLVRETGFQQVTAISDRFQRSLQRLAKNESEALELPRTFILDRGGVVRRIIGREGRDYVEQIRSTPGLSSGGP